MCKLDWLELLVILLSLMPGTGIIGVSHHSQLLSGLGEMAQLVKSLATKPSDPSAVSGTHMVGGEN